MRYQNWIELKEIMDFVCTNKEIYASKIAIAKAVKTGIFRRVTS